MPEQDLVKLEERIGEIVESRVRYVLTQGTDKERQLIYARVPYICTEIENINTALEKLSAMLETIQKDQVYSPLVQKIVFTAVTMIIVAVFASLIGLVIIKAI